MMVRDDDAGDDGADEEPPSGLASGVHDVAGLGEGYLTSYCFKNDRSRDAERKKKRREDRAHNCN